MAFVFWQNVASRHQRDLLRAIAALSGEEVVCAVESDLPGDRISFGWGGEDFEPVKLVRSDDRATFDSLVARRDDTHVLTGFFHHPVISDAFPELAGNGARIFLHSESVDTAGIKGAMRFARDRAKAFRVRRRVDGVLAIGRLAERYFGGLGFEPRKIIPFGYFVNGGSQWPAAGRARASVSKFRLVYAGQFIRRKGLDILFESVGRLTDLDWTLELIGSGQCQAALEDSAREQGISERIRWHGAVAPGRIHDEMAGADLLVLPSRWDGWGVVVNEALAAGVPVLCSDRCGAGCVLSDASIGEKFPAGDPEALSGILRSRIAAGPVPDGIRAACRAAAASLSPEAGARLFLDGLAALDSGSMPPPAPWMRTAGSPQFQHS